MTRTHFWFTGVALIGATASLTAAILLWMILTQPVAVAQALALGQ